LIRLNDVGVCYESRHGAVEALRRITLEIGTEFLGVVGPTGCGNSTLLRVIAGLVPLTSGMVEIAADASFSYGVVFQDYSLLPWLTVRQNIELPLKLHGVPPAEREEVGRRLTGLLDLDDVRDLWPYQLSGGMRQRVAVGRAFAPSPMILLMDEPFGALDTFTREELQETLARLYVYEPHTVVFVTHDVGEALLLCDRICVLSPRPGRVQEVINVPFPRPRRQEIKRDSQFLELKYQIEGLLRPEGSTIRGIKSDG